MTEFTFSWVGRFGVGARGENQLMSVDALETDEVLALRFDSEAVAAELAAWCGGEVLQGEGSRLTVWVPTPRGPRPALLGHWIVRRALDEYRPYAPDDFQAQFQPVG